MSESVSESESVNESVSESVSELLDYSVCRRTFLEKRHRKISFSTWVKGQA